MVVKGKLHAPAVLSPWMRTGGPQNRSGHGGEEKGNVKLIKQVIHPIQMGLGAHRIQYVNPSLVARHWFLSAPFSERITVLDNLFEEFISSCVLGVPKQ
jgi:hypothetical protein